MPNAFSIFVPSNRFLRSDSAKNAGISSSYDKIDKFSLTYGKIKVQTLQNGRTQMYLELEERAMRENVLLKYGLLSPAQSIWRFSKVLNGNTPENGIRKNKLAILDIVAPTDDLNEENIYDNDFEENLDLVVDKSKKNLPTQIRHREQCEYCSWSVLSRKMSIRYLCEFTKEEYDELQLKEYISNGSPPSPPKLWHVEAHDKVEILKFDIPFFSNLELHWGPANSNELVSFFSIECAGKFGQKMNDLHYKEVFRDPQDAGSKMLCTFNYIDSDLLPGTSYLFRIRAINGFGSSNYTYKVFATAVAAPIRPFTENLTHESANLVWLFSKKFHKFMFNLRSIFNKAKNNLLRCEDLVRIFEEEKTTFSINFHELLLKSTKCLGIDISQGLSSLFESIGTVDGYISWTDFEYFFISSNCLSAIDDSSSESSSSMRGFFGGDDNFSISEKSVKIRSGEVTFVLEKCTSEVMIDIFPFSKSKFIFLIIFLLLS
jgi:hypothetical protein